MFSSIGVSLAFFQSSFLGHTPLSCISPYFDQIVAIVLALGMMKEPIQMIGESFRSLMLLSPDEKEVAKSKAYPLLCWIIIHMIRYFMILRQQEEKCGYPSISQHELI